MRSGSLCSSRCSRCWRRPRRTRRPRSPRSPRRPSNTSSTADALAQAAGVPAHDVRRAGMLAGNPAAVAAAALTEGRGGLDAFRLTLLEPMQPMLAQTAEDPAAALAAFAPAAFEYKLDGA